MKVLHCTLFERHVLRFALTVFVVAVLILVVIIVIGVCLDLDALRGNYDLKTLNTHVRQIATYVASNQKMSKFSKLGFQMTCPLVDGVIDSDLCIEVQESFRGSLSGSRLRPGTKSISSSRFPLTSSWVRKYKATTREAAW